MSILNKTIQPNKEYLCVGSASCGYKVGQIYKSEVRKGVIGLVGGDGFFDPRDNLQSQFKLKEN